MKRLAASIVLVLRACLAGTDEFSTPSVIHCCNACYLVPNCKGVIYNETGLACQLRDTQDLFPMGLMTRGPDNWHQCTNLDEPPVNVARSYVAVEQSSTHGGKFTADKAVDGNRSRNAMRDRSCTHTRWGDYTPWFRLVLNTTYTIGRIVLTNRGSNLDRLSDFNVTLDGDLCYHYAGAAPAEAEVSCVGGPRRAQTIEITKYSEVITLCEIEIYFA